MQRRKLLRAGFLGASFLAASLTLATLTGCASSGAGGDGYTPLLDGKGFSGWSQIGAGNWRVEDGLTVGERGKAGFLVSNRTYKDFMIRAEFWVSEDANSGIFIRGENPKEMTGKTAYEVNVFDKRPDPTYATGAIVDVAKPATVIKAGGKWNTFEIIAKGNTLTVTLNGVRTVDGVRDDKHSAGYVGLQSDGGTVKFRKVDIKEL